MNVLKDMSKSLLLFSVYAMIYAALPVKTDSGEDLYNAAYVGDISKVRELAGDQCKNVNWQHPDNGWTPLMAATRRKDEHKGKHEQIVKYLMSCKADPDIRGYDGWSPIMIAAWPVAERFSIASCILTAKPNLEFQVTGGPWEHGTTALWWAADNQFTQLLSALLAAGAKTDIQDEGERGWTPLHKAAYYWRERNVKLLLRYGANTTIEDNEGHTAAQLAREIGAGTIASLIDDWVPHTDNASMSTTSVPYTCTANTVITDTATTALAVIAAIMLLQVLIIKDI